MKKELNIQTTNGKTIYGILSNPEESSQGLIIFVHGLTGSMDEDIFVHGEDYFNKKGYATCRFNLYGDQEAGRKLSETNLDEHIVDVNIIIKYFQGEGIKKIILIGHSFGGLTILYSDLSEISNVVLRDPSMGGKKTLQSVVYNEETSSYVIDWGSGTQYPISEKMYKDFCIDSENHLNKIKEIKLPIKIICAEHGLKLQSERYYGVANEPKEFAMVSGARHCFHEEGTEEKLFNETFDWINKY